MASLAEKYPFFVTLKFCREKKNIHICLNPILTPEEERASVAARQGALRVDQVLFRWRNFYPVLRRFVLCVSRQDEESENRTDCNGPNTCRGQHKAPDEKCQMGTLASV